MTLGASLRAFRGKAITKHGTGLLRQGMSWGFNISFASPPQTRRRCSGSGGKPCPPSPSPLGVAPTWVEALGARLGVMEELEEEVSAGGRKGNG